MWALTAAAVVASAAAARAHGSGEHRTLHVTSSADDGLGSLAEAIEVANAAMGPVVIKLETDVALSRALPTHTADFALTLKGSCDDDDDDDTRGYDSSDGENTDDDDDRCTITGADDTQLFRTESNVDMTIEDLVFVGGSVGVDVNADMDDTYTLTLSNVAFRGQSASGLYADLGSGEATGDVVLDFDDVTLSDVGDGENDFALDFTISTAGGVSGTFDRVVARNTGCTALDINDNSRAGSAYTVLRTLIDTAGVDGTDCDGVRVVHEDPSDGSLIVKLRGVTVLRAGRSGLRVEYDDDDDDGLLLEVLDSVLSYNYDGVHVFNEGDHKTEAVVARSTFNNNGNSGFHIDTDGLLVVDFNQVTANDNDRHGLFVREASTSEPPNQIDATFVHVTANGNYDDNIHIEEGGSGSGTGTLTAAFTSVEANDSTIGSGIFTIEGSDQQTLTFNAPISVNRNAVAGVEIDDSTSGPPTHIIGQANIAGTDNVQGLLLLRISGTAPLFLLD